MITKEEQTQLPGPSGLDSVLILALAVLPLFLAVPQHQALITLYWSGRLTSMGSSSPCFPPSPQSSLNKRFTAAPELREG